MNRKIVLIAIILLTSSAFIYWYWHDLKTPLTFNQQVESQPNALPDSSLPVEKIVFAAPGRVEGFGDTIEIGAPVSGVLSSVAVKEGQVVAAGQLLAIVSCDEFAGEIDAAKSSVEATRQTRVRLVRGSREEERQRAEVDVSAADSTLNHAKLHYERISRLVKEGVIARAEGETAQRDYELAQSALKSAQKRAELVNAPPLPEELAKADADIKANEERVKSLEAQLKKCAVKSPISGTILRVHLHTGEAVSPINPRSIMSIADTTELRVRAEVDERDIGRITLGQKVQISADAYPERKFLGTVATVGDVMGRKKTETGNASEKSDRDVLDVLINVNELNPKLAIGLRVTVQFINLTKSLK